CGVPAHQALASAADAGEDRVVEESEPELEALAAQLSDDAEPVGPAVPETGVGEVESAAPADAAATHGPPATAVAEAEGEVDLDISHAKMAPPAVVPAGIPIEHMPEELAEPAAE